MDISSGQLPTRATQALYVLRNADFTSTSDQAFTPLSGFTNFVANKVVAVCKTGGVTVLCIGGIYMGANKTGNQVVLAAQSWAGLSAGAKLVDSTLGSIVASQVLSGTPSLSLTTGSSAGVTADVFIFGFIVD